MDTAVRIIFFAYSLGASSILPSKWVSLFYLKFPSVFLQFYTFNFLFSANRNAYHLLAFPALCLFQFLPTSLLLACSHVKRLQPFLAHFSSALPPFEVQTLNQMMTLCHRVCGHLSSDLPSLLPLPCQSRWISFLVSNPFDQQRFRMFRTSREFGKHFGKRDSIYL